MKKYLFFVMVMICSLVQSQNIRISSLELTVPHNFTIADQKLLEQAKSKISVDKNYSAVVENFDISEFSSPKTYFYKNMKCNCMNTFQIMLADYNMDNINSDFLPNSEVADNLIYFYEETVKRNVTELNKLDAKASINISPIIVANSNMVNIIYYQMEYQLVKPTTAKLTKYIADYYVIPHQDYYYVTIFNSEKENYSEMKVGLKEYFNSIKLQ
ncbi:hypothetical protein MVI27_11065 [Chryseobacterium salipaludis]|uniref:hypothetical protein n=1 Tax=Chryseobacterium TaxID=59732 RepID=UPI001FF365AE|nr:MULTISPECIES: hypothetical protein [Chryseobacterium]MCJ8498788.1 hypothetical protein [Chryseobacterium salipaludis]MCX3297356.1 hypothetical protein [Planobacterium sp. JC490]